jgi:hypothetical protein
VLRHTHPYGVHVTEPDDDDRDAADDRRDNGRALAVVAVGVLVVVLASALLVTSKTAPDVAAPVPAPTSLTDRDQLPTAVFHEDGDNEHGDDTPLNHSHPSTPTPLSNPTTGASN